ncbi:galactose mutarotase-like isoform X2 [Cylas formicarius]|uniref:galactose mutarotase-like isoform X2 n=1 Tax=Cylas formicarius TaxID=197179 RepID=UPI0029586BD2|nr:galactose mutarotase-like isoform X2 [Cylas formicarius]
MSFVSLSENDFGILNTKNGERKTIKRFTWTNSQNVSVQVITYGGTITTLKIPDKHKKVEDVVMGFDDLNGYQSDMNAYFGCTVGRVCNRIANGKMTLDGKDYTLATNNGANHLHGGIQGFDKVVWDSYVRGNKVFLTYHSKDMEEGYPGDLIATVSFELTKNNEFLVDYKAVVTKPSPVNLTNHSYFNLAGHGKGSEELYKHQFTVNADRITEVDSTGIPTGNLPPVSGTVFDLRVPKTLGDVINKVPNAKGYDHNFCVTKASSQELAFVAKAHHPPSGRVMEVYSNQPGVQFYTGNFLPETDVSQGKGAVYKKHGAFCFETQIYPDAINHPNFPKVVLYPGEEYHHSTVFKFLIEN